MPTPLPARPTPEIVDTIVPPYDIDGLHISDGYYMRDISHATLQGALRVPRSGGVTLVAHTAHYDGANGGVPGNYANIFAELVQGKTAWRLAGVRILAAEAARLAGDMLKKRPSKPAKGESPRPGGKETVLGESQLRGAPSKRGFVVYIRHRNRAGEWARTRGAEVLTAEVPAVRAFLKTLADAK